MWEGSRASWDVLSMLGHAFPVFHNVAAMRGSTMAAIGRYMEIWAYVTFEPKSV